MDFIFGSINGHYLRNINLRAASETDEVWAAVAYATDTKLLFDWCHEKHKPLKFWGRLDDNIAVSLPVLEMFLKRSSPKCVCKLVKHHHAKIIWWRGYGVYIGSANLTDKAWNKNIEAGVFIEEINLDGEKIFELESIFEKLDQHASPLNEELYKLMVSRRKEIKDPPPSHGFWSNSSVRDWEGLNRPETLNGRDRYKENFLKEWYSTLTILRDIGKLVSSDEFRPDWIDPNLSIGIQTDQFLSAHYYLRTFDKRRGMYEEWFDKNKSNSDKALRDAANWWKNLEFAPEAEEKMIRITIPKLQEMLSKDNILNLSKEDFTFICSNIHSIGEYARKIENSEIGLPPNQQSMDVKKIALADRFWTTKTGNNSSVLEMLHFVLYGGPSGSTPDRLLAADLDYEWKIRGLGISALGEIVGRAMPGEFPPRNGRTSKALRSLGFDVKLHSV